MSNEIAVREMLEEYYRAFSTLNIRAILPLLHEPALLIGPQGVFPLPTPSEIEPIFGPVMENLQTRGYARSELESPETRMLGAESASVTGIAVRYGAGGAEMERAGITYLLRKTDDAWKIAVMVLHGAPAV
jgi:ketosteroid isomerase-like protein